MEKRSSTLLLTDLRMELSYPPGSQVFLLDPSLIAFTDRGFLRQDSFLGVNSFLDQIHHRFVAGYFTTSIGSRKALQALSKKDAKDLCTSVTGLCDTVVGVLGGGQLGRMLCQAASKMGVKVAVLDPMENCPASAIAHKHVVGSFRDTEAVQEFAKGCGVLTVEIEHVDVETLDVLEKQGMDCQPNPSTIRLIQDKYLQKVHFHKHDVPLPDFMQIDCFESAEKAGDLFSYPLMIKSRRLAYDGRGNAVAYCKEDISTAVSALGGFERGLYAEKWAPFIKELAVIVARGRDDTLCCFPVVETTHKDSICHTVEAPADISTEISKMAVCVAERAVSSLKGAGVFAVELFLIGDGQILVNEIAPRPHNSGHHTIEACYVSQFEQHLRAILGLPLGDTSMKVPAAIMHNILGEDEGENGFVKSHQLMRRAVSVPGASVHWYEKPEMRKQRKMGHITVVGPSTGVVRARVKSIIDGNNQDGSFGIGSTQHSKSASRFSDNVFASTSGNDSSGSPQVGIIMGSDSDLPVMKVAAEVLDLFNVPYEITIVSAHRTPERMVGYAKQAHGRGIKVIIAGAGGAAHLPGMIASMTTLPVLGVPVRGSSLDGMDSLLSIVQMPKGVPVATFAIQNATNAALFAVRIFATTDTDLHKSDEDDPSKSEKDHHIDEADDQDEADFKKMMLMKVTVMILTLLQMMK
ncbi:hypothetical protein KI387_001254 [Taxus chinensis]|uniref:phosphoribosylaminoimidazole carboxylase n=1 Tax=Taxus chinensis TaxID=29808 RepID=A0AA38GUF5_TAXCH|nr:hypothetical protein KI387_001254 [Taxus chinensis]